MKAELIIPIEVLRGKLNKDGYYFRKYRGHIGWLKVKPTTKSTATKPAKKRQKSQKEWHMLAYVIFYLYLRSSQRVPTEITVKKSCK